MPRLTKIEVLKTKDKKIPESSLRKMMYCMLNSTDSDVDFSSETTLCKRPHDV